MHFSEQVQGPGGGDPQAAHARVHVQVYVGLYSHHASQLLERPTAVHRVDTDVYFMPQTCGQLLLNHGSENQNGGLEPRLTQFKGFLGSSHPQGTDPTP